jgi:hypothetical protein
MVHQLVLQQRFEAPESPAMPAGNSIAAHSTMLFEQVLEPESALSDC